MSPSRGSHKRFTISEVTAE